MLETDHLPAQSREKPRSRASLPSRGWDLGRLLAQVLCALLGVVGLVPVAAALLVSSAPVQRWAEQETRRLLQAQFGVAAEYQVGVRLLPLRLEITRLVVKASDGGSPVLTAESVSASPRVFSLLSGRLDLGDIELQRPRARLVLRDGKLTNLKYKLPETPANRSGSQETPFFSLAVTEGRFSLDVDGALIETGAVDLDVFAEENGVFEVSLHSGQTTFRRSRIDQTPEVQSTGQTVWDDDLLCRFEARVRADPERILVRRFSLLGVADGDPARGNTLSCENVDANPRQVALRLSQLRVGLRKGGLPRVHGHLTARAPADLTNRFVKTLPLAGWAALSGDLAFDGVSRLPEFKGRITGAGLAFERYKLAKELEVELALADEVIRVPSFRMLFADGDVRLRNARIDPFAPGGRIEVEAVDGDGMEFSGLMRDLGVTPDTIVFWTLEKTQVRKIAGTFSPLAIDAELVAHTKNFEVFDRAYHDQQRRHMIGVKQALVRGRIGVRPHAFEIYDTRTDFGKSSMHVALVSIGFDNTIKLVIPKGSKLDLADASPLVDIPMAGKAELDVQMSGQGGDPLLTGNVKIAGFELGGFPFGDLTSAKVRFRPLWLELSEVAAQKGKSQYRIPSARLDFEARSGASIVVDAEVASSSFDIRDFFAMWHFDKDPRWDEVKGETALAARVRYVYGGKEDVCAGGLLESRGRLGFHRLELFEERYDGGEAEFDFRWFDRDATYHGMELSLSSLTLRKGPGLVIGSVDVSRGAKVSGHLVATAVPLNKLDAVPALLRSADARLSAEAEVSGSLDLLEVAARARMTPVQMGRSSLPASEFTVQLVPIAVNRPALRVTRCGGPVTAPYDRSEYDADRSSGLFVVNGKLFGGQVALRDLTVTRQRDKIVRGGVVLDDFDLSPALELSSTVALSESRAEGRASGTIELEELRMAEPSASRVRAKLEELRLSRAGYTVELLPGSQALRVADRRVDVSGLGLSVLTPRGQRASFDVSGVVSRIDGAPEVDAVLALRPVALGSLVGVLPRVERASGMLGGRIRLQGPLSNPNYSGGFELARGEMTLRGLAAPLTEIDLAVAIDGRELSVKRGSARLGSGSLTLSGGAPLRGFDLGAARFNLKARDVALPLGDGIRAVADADLTTNFDSGSSRNLPRLTGDVVLKGFEYRRAVTMTADISSLAQRGRRTAVEAYDPDEDVVAFDVTLKATRALRLQNNLIEADLTIGEEGLQLLGTNGRYGMRGVVELARGGRITLRRSEFEITEGTVRFSDASRIAPEVDVTAVTDYRRYADASEPAAAGGSSSGAGAIASVSGGRWNIRMHAHGDADNLKIDLTSDPALAQDDIFLLLTVGLTRAELDQAQSAAAGESVALEALGTLSGADRAVTDAVPLIDDFRFGSAYSSRTGRTEPTVTIGKRLAERVRANVTTGLSESREVRSNVEWRLSNRVSVEGSYDNVNDISSSSLGNLGADIRWRLEFE